jgi:hypothetical protein
MEKIEIRVREMEKEEKCSYCKKDMNTYNHYGRKRVICCCGVFCSQTCLNKKHEEMNRRNGTKLT